VGTLETVGRPARILVVDDDTGLRDALAELLRENGFEVSCAADGSEALGRLGDADAPPPSLILLDLTMPVMDGWTFRAAQRSDPRLADIPTVVLSATLGVDARALETLAPAAALAKPFELDRLIETVQRLCAHEAVPITRP
jgi:CheY-like chemotaxis protein